MPFSRPEACNVLACEVGPDNTRAYLVGWRCPQHTPAAVAGKPEPASSGPRYVPPPRVDPAIAAAAAAHAARPATRESIARVQRLAHKAGRRPADAPGVRPGRTVTSSVAAARVLPKTGTQRRDVLDAIVEAYVKQHLGATDPELSRRLGVSGNSIRPRRGELATAGLVVDTGHTRAHEGNPHIVWGPSTGVLAALRALPSH